VCPRSNRDSAGLADVARGLAGSSPGWTRPRLRWAPSIAVAPRRPSGRSTSRCTWTRIRRSAGSAYLGVRLLEIECASRVGRRPSDVGCPVGRRTRKGDRPAPFPFCAGSPRNRSASRALRGPGLPQGLRRLASTPTLVRQRRLRQPRPRCRPQSTAKGQGFATAERVMAEISSTFLKGPVDSRIASSKGTQVPQRGPLLGVVTLSD
jgi:hypothetical protein